MRLHLGASIAQLSDERLLPILNSDWIHLGEPEADMHPHNDASESSAGSAPEQELAKLRDRTDYRSFNYVRGDRLPFPDNSFSFVFSEHFFEHLFLDEAGDLFKECKRVMAPNACMRIVVPDADLRTYQPPEPAGFSNDDSRWTHPAKHKTRWSIYSLRYVLEEIGLATRGVVYCDKHGQYHQDESPSDPSFYSQCLDRQFIESTQYILRFGISLIVDAVKRPA